MTLWTRITAPLRKSAAPDWGTLERYLGWAFGGGVSSSGIIVNPQNAMQSAAVFGCIRVLSESIGMLPLCVYQQGDDNTKTPARRHDLWELLHHQPNDYQTAVEFWETMVVHLCLRGNAYAYITRARSGRVVELIPLHPDMVNVTMDGQNQVIYRVGMEAGGTRQVDRSEILHIKGLTLNGWLGVSPIAYARESIGLALATEKFGGQLFKNGAKMGGVLEVPTLMSDVAYARLKNSFDTASSGENAHKTAIVEEGAKYAKISMNADESQFLETRKYQRAEIAGIFRVPAHMINDLDKATFSNISSLDLQFLKYSLRPWLRRITQAVRRDLFSPADRKTCSLGHDLTDLLYGDAATRGKFYHDGILDGWLLRNEARAMEGLNPIDGLSVPLMPLNMTDGSDDPSEPADEAAATAAPVASKPEGAK